MLYYLQLFHLGKYSIPLFDETIEAWTYGPVIPVVYYRFKDYEDNTIRFLVPNVDNNIDDDTKNFIIKNIRILDTYTPTELVNLSRKEGTPWSIVWGKGEGRFGIISTNLMINYYKSIIG